MLALLYINVAGKICVKKLSLYLELKWDIFCRNGAISVYI